MKVSKFILLNNIAFAENILTFLQGILLILLGTNYLPAFGLRLLLISLLMLSFGLEFCLEKWDHQVTSQGDPGPSGQILQHELDWRHLLIPVLVAATIAVSGIIFALIRFQIPLFVSTGILLLVIACLSTTINLYLRVSVLKR